jgi:type III restriction enzyme
MGRLVALESDSRTEIVIHVNKLKEGWDVTNLYTIVPLRASASDILTEQTLGRGLRLPYGIRVARGELEEFAAVDRLTVIAHERFDEVIQRAKEPGSIVQMKTLLIGEGGDISPTGTTLIEAPSLAEIILTGAQPLIPGLAETPQKDLMFQTPQEIQMANITLQVVQRYERRLGSVDALCDAEVQRKIVEEVTELTTPLQGTLEGVVKAPDIGKVVKAVTETVAERTISIPKIVVLPRNRSHSVSTTSTWMLSARSTTVLSAMNCWSRTCARAHASFSREWRRGKPKCALRITSSVISSSATRSTTTPMRTSFTSCPGRSCSACALILRQTTRSTTFC